jgi:predicted secreted hydrolase
MVVRHRLAQYAGRQAAGLPGTFFRSASSHDRANPSQFAPKQLIIGHAALSDPANGKLLHDQRSAREGFGLSYAKPATRTSSWKTGTCCAPPTAATPSASTAPSSNLTSS